MQNGQCVDNVQGHEDAIQLVIPNEQIDRVFISIQTMSETNNIEPKQTAQYKIGD